MLTNYLEHYKKDAELFDFFNLHINNEVENNRRYQEHFRLLNISQSENLFEIGSGAGVAGVVADVTKQGVFGEGT